MSKGIQVTPRSIPPILLALCCSAASGASLARTDAHGRITSMAIEGEPIAITTNVRIPLPGWSRLPGLENAKDVKTSRDGARTTWKGTVDLAAGSSVRYEQTLEEQDGTVHIGLRVRAETEVATEGAFFWLTVPVPIFGGGTCDLAKGDAPAASAPMPSKRPARRHFVSATADAAHFVAQAGTPRLELSLDRPCPIVVQDNREWNSPTYSAFIRFAGQRLAKGQTASLTVRLRLTGEPDRTPAALTLDATKRRYRIDGFGGNYCFGIESPVSHYTLDNLRVAWARTEMTLPDWEPRNDNASPAETDWAFLEGHDRADTNLRREFLLAQKIQKKGIPYSITIWHLPEWLYAKPRSDGQRPNRRRVHPGKWPELLESIGSYLLYAKRKYGVEPDLFSFNEPGIGCRVLFTAEEHRDAIKRIGSHLAKLGLRTRMLLGDVTAFRRSIAYPEPAAKDPEAMRHVGALAFHSWGGGSPEHYAAWADLADRLELPLFVAELGVDASAWRGRAFRSFAYGLREVRMYQEILLHARPRATMQWEFTSDYALVDTPKDAAGNVVLKPTARFWFIKHFCNLTPPQAHALATASDHPKVLFTAFEGGGPVHTLHIANFAAGRPATIAGLPAGMAALRAVRTSETESFKSLPPVVVRDGKVSVELAAQSLLTLTTMPPER